MKSAVLYKPLSNVLKQYLLSTIQESEESFINTNSKVNLIMAKVSFLITVKRGNKKRFNIEGNQIKELKQ